MNTNQILCINEAVQLVLNQVDTCTIDNCPVLVGYPAGGCARDVLYGASTKDVDILVPMGEYLTESEAF